MCQLLIFPHFPSVGNLKTIFKKIFKTDLTKVGLQLFRNWTCRVWGSIACFHKFRQKVGTVNIGVTIIAEISEPLSDYLGRSCSSLALLPSRSCQLTWKSEKDWLAYVIGQGGATTDPSLSVLYVRQMYTVLKYFQTDRKTCTDSSQSKWHHLTLHRAHHNCGGLTPYGTGCPNESPSRLFVCLLVCSWYSWTARWRARVAWYTDGTTNWREWGLLGKKQRG